MHEDFRAGLRGGTVDQIREYEAIADAYADSMRLAFRDAIEKHTLLELLGDVSGAKALGMACGDGYYMRLGASEATGVDVSAQMVRRAEELERREPLGCTYRLSEGADFEATRTRGRHRRNRLPGLFQEFRTAPPVLSGLPRRLAPRRPVRRPERQYGLERACADPPSEGDVVRYTLVNEDAARQWGTDA